MDCVFCKIVAGEIPANIVYRDDSVVAFEDLNKQAPYHLLIIPQKHIATLNDLEAKDAHLIAHMVFRAAMLAKEYNIAQAGYRLVMNCNEGAGQSVFHLHMHFLGGRTLHWPPG